jgi:hypothetical protein
LSLDGKEKVYELVTLLDVYGEYAEYESDAFKMQFLWRFVVPGVYL